MDDVDLVTESFRDFCKKEILTGDNLYDAGAEHGLQVGLSNNGDIPVEFTCLGS